MQECAWLLAFRERMMAVRFVDADDIGNRRLEKVSETIEKLTPDTARPGMGCHRSMWSDVVPCTVLVVLRKGKRLLIRENSAHVVRKGTFIPGGFSVVCVEPPVLELYEDPQCHMEYVNWSNKWKCYLSEGRTPVRGGRVCHYDWNF